jgi:hypothetical protein
MNRQIFHQGLKNGCQDIMVESAPSEKKEETTNSKLRARDVGALTILGILTPPIRKSG